MNRFSAPLLALSRPVKRLVVGLLDCVLSIFSVWGAFYLRIDQTGLPQFQQLYVYILAPILVLPCFMQFGLYRAIFRYTGITALASTAKAIFLYAVILFSILLIFKWDGVPRSVGLIQPMLLLLMVSSSRIVARRWLLGKHGKATKDKGRLLVYGAGEAGVQTISALGLTNEFILLGLVDDDKAKIGCSINGVEIFSADEIGDAVCFMGITDILLAIPSLGRTRRNEIISRLRELPVHVRTLPGMVDLASGRITVQDFQELDVEDLLGRPPVPPDTVALARKLAGQMVLVTGAGGSIGSELCRQIIRENPRQLLLVDHSEFALYTIHRELVEFAAEADCPVEIVPVLASIRHAKKIRDIFALYKPNIVYHAAAYKHVPLVEINVAEGVQNNVFGTLNVAQAAIEHQVQYFVLVSTDKAVRPTNVMGATKRVAELVLQSLADSDSVNFESGGCVVSAINNTIFSMVRFGNVLGSSGSVVPLFRRQIQKGGPLTVTHQDVTRYFMTIPEAAQLVLQAGAMAQGGEVFVLDMGQPIKIIDLAYRMIKLSGMTVRDADHPDGDIEVKIVGLRPSEKLYEELLIGDNPERTGHLRIMKAHENFIEWEEISPMLQSLKIASEHINEYQIKEILQQLVQGYNQKIGKNNNLIAQQLENLNS